MASSDTIPSMFKSKFARMIIVLVGLALFAVLAYQIPAVNARLSWRIDIALTYLRGVVQPVEAIPTPETAFRGSYPRVDAIPHTRTNRHDIPNPPRDEFSNPHADALIYANTNGPPRERFAPGPGMGQARLE